MEIYVKVLVLTSNTAIPTFHVMKDVSAVCYSDRE